VGSESSNKGNVGERKNEGERAEGENDQAGARKKEKKKNGGRAGERGWSVVNSRKQINKLNK